MKNVITKDVFECKDQYQLFFVVFWNRRPTACSVIVLFSWFRPSIPLGSVGFYLQEKNGLRRPLLCIRWISGPYKIVVPFCPRGALWFEILRKISLNFFCPSNRLLGG